jgi:hypothetical protein
MADGDRPPPDLALVEGDAGSRRNQRVTQRVWGLIFYLCVFALFAWQLVGELRARTQSAESLQWATVPGQITSSVERSAGSWKRAVPCVWAEICFRYAVGGAPQTSCRATFRKSGCRASTVAALRNQFPVGAEVTVFYDPRARDEAVLVPGSWRGEPMIRTWLLLMALTGFLAAFNAWRLARPPEADAAIGEPPADPPQV